MTDSQECAVIGGAPEGSPPPNLCVATGGAGHQGVEEADTALAQQRT